MFLRLAGIGFFHRDPNFVMPVVFLIFRIEMVDLDFIILRLHITRIDGPEIHFFVPLIIM